MSMRTIAFFLVLLAGCSGDLPFFKEAKRHFEQNQSAIVDLKDFVIGLGVVGLRRTASPSSARLHSQAGVIDEESERKIRTALSEANVVSAFFGDDEFIAEVAPQKKRGRTYTISYVFGESSSRVAACDGYPVDIPCGQCETMLSVEGWRLAISWYPSNIGPKELDACVLEGAREM